MKWPNNGRENTTNVVVYISSAILFYSFSSLWFHIYCIRTWTCLPISNSLFFALIHSTIVSVDRIGYLLRMWQINNNSHIIFPCIGFDVIYDYYWSFEFVVVAFGSQQAIICVTSGVFNVSSTGVFFGRVMQSIFLHFHTHIFAHLWKRSSQNSLSIPPSIESIGIVSFKREISFIH